MIRIAQTCDGCALERELRNVGEAMNAGWREVSSGKHLCARCIDAALAKAAGS